MIKSGQINTLKVLKKFNHKYILDGEELGEITLSEREMQTQLKIGDSIKVFIYNDRESSITASTKLPAALPGNCAELKVVSVNSAGAFLDWGLSTDLFVPYSEQRKEIKEGRTYVVYILQNELKGNIIGSTKIEKHLNKIAHKFSEGERVDLLIYDSTDISYKAIINNTHTGILYKNEIFKEVKTGLKIKGYIKKIREDKKIDLCLEKPGFTKVVSIADKILIFLEQNEGVLYITDKSSPVEISSLFGVSKSTYKKALGTLYKKKLISIEDEKIILIKKK